MLEYAARHLEMPPAERQEKKEAVAHKKKAYEMKILGAPKQRQVVKPPQVSVDTTPWKTVSKMIELFIGLLIQEGIITQDKKSLAQELSAQAFHLAGEKTRASTGAMEEKSLGGQSDTSQTRVEDAEGRSVVLKRVSLSQVVAANETQQQPKVVKKSKRGGKYAASPLDMSKRICPVCGERKGMQGVANHEKVCQGLERMKYDSRKDEWTCKSCSEVMKSWLAQEEHMCDGDEDYDDEQ